MRNSDKWVRWNVRDDLQERFAILTEISNDGTRKFFFTVSKFPDELLGEVTERLDAEFECFSQCTEGRTHYTLELLTFKELIDEYRIRAIRERREGGMRSVCFYAVRVRRIISDIEYRYEAEYELAAAGAPQPSTVDVDAVQTDPASDKKSGDWVRIDDWAAEVSTSEPERKKIMRRVRNDRGNGKEEYTGKCYNGYKIYKDSKGRRFYKCKGNARVYNREDLDNDKSSL